MAKDPRMKWNKRNIDIEEGMERLAQFIQNYHGVQDWQNTVYNLRDYLAVFIGAKGKEVYEDLMERMKDNK
jgi:hypothetical protein